MATITTKSTPTFIMELSVVELQVLRALVSDSYGREIVVRKGLYSAMIDALESAGIERKYKAVHGRLTDDS